MCNQRSCCRGGLSLMQLLSIRSEPDMRYVNTETVWKKRNSPVQTLRLMMTSRKRRGCCCCYISDDPLRLFLEADDNCDVVAGIELFTATIAAWPWWYTTTHFRKLSAIVYQFQPPTSLKLIRWVFSCCTSVGTTSQRANISSGK